MGWKTDLRLSDAEPDRKVEITCKRCGKMRYEAVREVMARPDLRQAYFDEAEKALRCHDRFCRGAVRITLTHQGRMEGFVGGMA